MSKESISAGFRLAAGRLTAIAGQELRIDSPRMAPGHFGAGPFIRMLLTLGLC